MKRIISLLLIFVIFLGFSACAEDTEAVPNNTTIPSTTTGLVDSSTLTILYTNDVHSAYERDDSQGRLGYAALAAYAQSLTDDGKTVVLIDGGDAIQGEAVATLSKGSYLVDIMNEMGYLMSVPGNHEFDFGMDVFLELAQNRSEYTYVSCNFIDLKTGEPVFKPYILKDFGGKLVAFVGISTPESYTKSTPAYFKDETGAFIYGFAEGNNGQELYDRVQQAIDDAVNEGADYVICVGHAGTDPSSSPWTSLEIIANTTGMVAFLDAHSHSVIPSQIVKDKDDNDVLICSTGSKFTAFGEITLDLNTGDVSSKLVTQLEEDDKEILEFTDNISAKFEDLLNEVVATSEVDLVINDPEDEDTRIVRTQETNLGDFCADAYRMVLNTDVAFVNGGGIRDEIKTGDITYGDIINIHPFGNSACVIEATGQEILDALELSVSQLGVGENGGFLQVSGLTMEVDLSTQSSVKRDDKDNFLAVEGERRIKNVMIGDEPIDPAKIYTVASHNYMLLLGGDGYTMFADNAVLQQEVMLDNQVLITYIQQHLNGAITKEMYGEPYGQNRIVFVEPEENE